MKCLAILISSALLSLSLARAHLHASPEPLPEALASPEAFPDALPEPLPEPIAIPEPRAEGGLESRQAPLARVITRCTRANNVALTFDDGPYIYQSGECE